MSGSTGKMLHQVFGGGDTFGGASPKVGVSPREHLSPLKIFVLAKKEINSTFGDISKYVSEGGEFLSSLELDKMPVIDNADRETVLAFPDKVRGIREVLARDHMKCVFFGRTSNGKSTVINAMLQDKILPSGLGHTTNCFLQVEGSKNNEAYLMLENTSEKRSVESVSQLGNALHGESLDPNALVRIFWPSNKCNLLRDDVVLLDSPGVDVSPNVDDWIDKYCLDADVFVIVANAESTLTTTEKKFFHKVSERLSKPNVFILNNRWDASANEPECIDKVRKQHLDRNISFLLEELKVYGSRSQAEERVFFVSAREVLNTRIQKLKGEQPSGGQIEGYQSRYFEFEDFERKFEKCLSETAVKTKFQQHCERGVKIVSEVMQIMDKAFQNATSLRESKIADRNEYLDRLEFTKMQMHELTDEVKHRIEQLVEQVECQVTQALSEEIRKLNVLVTEYERPFHPDPALLNLYKKELHTYVEKGLGSNLKARLNLPLQCSVETSQKEMVNRLGQLIPENLQAQMQNALPRNHFEPLYRLNCESLCCDFQEDLEFRFSLGFVAIINRFLGPRKAQHPLLGQSSIPRPLPNATPTDSPAPTRLREAFGNPAEECLALMTKTALLSPTSQTAVGLFAVAGIVVRTVGWKVIIITVGAYGIVYAYERMTWTNKAKEKAFKKQYVQHASAKLKLIVELTSSNCSHQVQQELSGTFARLGHLVDEVVTDMEAEVSNLDKQISEADGAAGQARKLRNRAGYLETELDTFSKKYLRHEEE
ncbi:transmembrane GTPase Marf [Galendromus occidentalis]|uniref:Transmembrane GTPase Marf n=1 Tax=Galendromus occidentalis TaxID=34638 RepID=A0AAJ6QS81_9ACAR|nr:transmembrane GTPase Marf [Galendromus occidentalis]